MLVDDRTSRPAALKPRRAGDEDELKVLVRFLVPGMDSGLERRARVRSGQGTPARIGAWNASSPAQRDLRAPRASLVGGAEQE